MHRDPRLRKELNVSENQRDRPRPNSVNANISTRSASRPDSSADRQTSPSVRQASFG